jgi:ferric-dicitrate binding protein FerR (iron transport regulator)
VEEYLKRMEAKGETSMNEEEEQRLKQTMWLQIQQRTGKRPAKVVQGSWYQTKVVRLSAAVAAACAIIMIFIWRPWENSLGDGNFQTVTVAQGSPIEKVKLADGTLVWVKPNSSLTYPIAFQGSSREINLKGEALFEVAKDSVHPFIVHSNNMDVRVVGTSFNIKDAVEKDTVEIAVLTGRVWVDPLTQSDAGKIELHPNNKLMISKKDGVLQKEVFASTESYTVGTEYDMLFVNTPLDSISKRIEEKFDVVIELDAPSHKDCRVSGDFTDRPLSHTIDVLCRTLGASYSLKQDTVKISGLKCK